MTSPWFVAAVAAVRMKKTAELFSQAGQSGVRKEEEVGFGAVMK